jgi:hypothetical protein
MNFRNLFPQDTRSAELVSSGSLIVFGIGMLLDNIGLSISQYHEFFAVAIVSMIFGIIQFIAILNHPNLELSRVIFSWINGTFWIWLAHMMFVVSITGGMLCLVLAISNYAAFLVNLNILRILWNP